MLSTILMCIGGGLGVGFFAGIMVAPERYNYLAEREKALRDVRMRELELREKFMLEADDS